MDWFLYDRDLPHERIKGNQAMKFGQLIENKRNIFL